MQEENSKMSQVNLEVNNIKKNVDQNESDLNSNNLDNMENELVIKLRKTCDKDGRERIPTESALFLYQLGNVYHKRGTDMFSLIRSAVLYNAAIARKPTKYVEEIKNDLHKLCEDILTQAGAKLRKDLIQHSKSVKEAVTCMRTNVIERLVSLQPIGKNLSKEKIKQLEAEKIEYIKNLQNQITFEYKEIMAMLAGFCHEVMGEPPCQFALAGMGSLARKEITPYSDFEHIILLQSNVLHNLSDNKKNEIFHYFRWFSVIFQTVLINLQETIIPSVAIPTLNDYNSTESNWFYDNVTTKGISFDGMMPYACKYPLGRQQQTKDKPWKTELIKPVEDMLDYLNSEENLKNGYHLGDVLTKTCFVYGDRNLYNLFETGVYKRLAMQYQQDMEVIEEGIKLEHNYGAKQVKSQIVNDLNEYATRSTLFQLYLKKTLNIKKVVYRSTTLFIAALGRICNIHASSCVEIIEGLYANDELSEYAKHKLMYAVAVACEIRLRWYMQNFRQSDEIESNSNGDKPLDALVSLVGSNCIINYFQIAYALQCDLSKRMQLKKLHFYSNPQLLNLSLFYFLGNLKCSKDFVVSQTKVIENKRLNSFDECLNILETESPQSTDPSLLQENFKPKEMVAKHFYEIGTVLKEKEIYDDAIEYLLISKEMLKENNCNSQNVCITENRSNSKNALTDSIEVNKDILKFIEQNVFNVVHSPFIVDCMYNIGYCFLTLLRPKKAIKCFYEALLYNERTIQKSERKKKSVEIFCRIGSCLALTYKLTEAQTLLNQALQLANEDLVSIDSEIKADIEMEIGTCLFLMNKPTESKKYFKNALQVKEELHLQEECPKKRSDLLCGMGTCARFLNHKQTMKNHFKQALKDKSKISKNPKSDVSIAVTLSNFGWSIIETNPSKALKYFNKAIDITKEATLDRDADRRYALILQGIGKSCLALNRQNKALFYNKLALQIHKSACRNEDDDILYLSSQYEIGECYAISENSAQAVPYFKNILQLQKTSVKQYGSKAVIHNTKNVGYSLLLSDQPEKSLEYFQRALQIQESISPDSKNDTALIEILHGMRFSLLKLNKPDDALKYAERALRIAENTTLDAETDLNVAVCLESVGICYSVLNKHEEKRYCYERSLRIRESKFSKSNSGLIFTLNQIGISLVEAEKFFEALSYFCRSLRIEETSSLDSEKDAELASSLKRVGIIYASRLNDFDSALAYFTKSLFIEQSLSSKFYSDSSSVDSLERVGICLFHLQKFIDSKQYFQRALQILTSNDTKTSSPDIEKLQSLILNLELIAKCLFNLALAEEALDYIQKALKIRRRISLDVECDIVLIPTLNMLGQCYFSCGKFEVALNCFEQALQILGANNLNCVKFDPGAMVSILKSCGSCLHEMQHTDTAKQYFERAEQIEESSSSKNRVTSFADKQTQTDF